MPLDKNNPRNKEVLRIRNLQPGIGQIIFRAGEELRDPDSGKIFKLPMQCTCKPKDFAELRVERKERWQNLMTGAAA